MAQVMHRASHPCVHIFNLCLICFKNICDEHAFLVVYFIIASYFAGVMVHLMLTSTPVVRVAVVIAISTLLSIHSDL